MGKAIKISNVDFSKTGLGTVTFLVPLQSLAIVGDSSVSGSSQYSVTYTPNATFEKGIVWSIVSGSEYATIDQTGLVTALAGAENNNVTIRATSSSHSSIYAEKNITVTEASVLLNVHKIFGGTVDDVIETDYMLFDSSMPNWTLLVYAPDTPSGNSFRTAVHCMDESGSPYNGITFQKVNNNVYRGVNCDLNLTESYGMNKVTRIFTTEATSGQRFAGNHEMPIGISRDGDNMYYTTDGEIWRLLSGTPVQKQNKLVIGAYRDANGDLGRYYNSNGEYLDVVLYSQSRADSQSFFSQHGVKPAFYTLNNHTCDGTENTVIDTGLKLFDGTTYPNGVLMQVDLTLPVTSVVQEQTLFGCKSYGETVAHGLKVTNKSSNKMTYNITPVIATVEATVTRGNRYMLGVRIKDKDYGVTFGDTNSTSTDSGVTAHNWPLTIGGALSELPNTWYPERFAAFTIHNMTIREL